MFIFSFFPPKNVCVCVCVCVCIIFIYLVVPGLSCSI